MFEVSYIMSNCIIEVDDLRKSFEGKEILNGVSLRIKKGESYVVIGRSGTGKSVLIKCILNIIRPDSGSVKVFNNEICDCGRNNLTKYGVLFQGGALFDSLNVLENVAFGLIYGCGMKKKDAYEIARQKLIDVNLDERLVKSYPSELSGGTQKRVALARAIAANPSIIFLDEPTAGLDPITSNMISDLIRKCIETDEISALSITHDLQSLRKIADKVGFLHEGKIVWNGEISEMDGTDNEYVSNFIKGCTYSHNGPAQLNSAVMKF
jgi:phospholipid/cholesterol/gamma-HCH transport system ATP-binding protein